MEIRSTLSLTNKRLDDLNAHQVDQNRRIDAVRQELDSHIDEMHKRIDETNMRFDRLYEVLSGGRSISKSRPASSVWNRR